MSEGKTVDLRSDTVTRPGPEMRAAMAAAEVGDDVYGEDPTVARLEAVAAERVGHEAALFVPSGTMGNQIAVNLLSRPGTEVVMAEGSHVYLYELGAMAAWSGVLPRLLPAPRGVFAAETLEASMPADAYYLTRPSLLVLENSHNHAGGVVLDVDAKDRLLEVARARGLGAHLDGARLFNAAHALGVEATTLARGFDSVMFCLSKGLGAPVGSVLCGSRALVREARVVRKRMGGGMRQAGVLAAAGLYALERNVARLAEDHARARRLAETLARHPAFRLDPDAVATNIVIADCDPERSDAMLAALRRAGILAGAMGRGRVRFVTHLDVDDAGLERALRAIAELPG